MANIKNPLLLLDLLKKVTFSPENETIFEGLLAQTTVPNSLESTLGIGIKTPKNLAADQNPPSPVEGDYKSFADASQRPQDFTSIGDLITNSQTGNGLLAQRFDLAKEIDALNDFKYENSREADNRKELEEIREVDGGIQSLPGPTTPLIRGISAPGNELLGLESKEDNLFSIFDTVIIFPQDILTTVVISGIPLGAQAFDVSDPQNPVTLPIVNGALTVSGQTDLDNLRFDPPQDSDIDFDLTITATVTGPNGQSATGTGSIPVYVEPVVDGIDHTSSGGAGLEDAASIPLGDVTIILKDIDGSESADNLIITFDPDPATGTYAILSYNGNDSVNGVLTIPLVETFPGSFQSLIQGLGLKPVSNSAHDVELTYAVTTTDEDSENLYPDSVVTQQWTETVVVTPVVDATLGRVTTSNTDEDVAVNLAFPAVDLTIDTDGSETLDLTFTLSNIPVGTEVYVGDPNAGGVLQTVTTGSVTLNTADLANIYIIPPEHSSDNFDLTVSFTVTDTDPDNVADNATAVLSAQIPVEVSAVVDNTTIDLGMNVNKNGALPGDVTVLEDGNVPLDPITLSLVDVDGSETATEIVITFDPDPATGNYAIVSYGGVDSVNGTLTIPIVLDGTTTSQIVLSGITVEPPENSDDDIQLTFSVTTTDTDPDAPGNIEIGTVVATLDVLVQAVADTPNLDDPIDQSSLITQTFSLDFSGSLNDATDGSETLSFELSGLPVGSVLTATNGFSTTTTNTDPVVLTPNDLAGLQVEFPQTSAGLGVHDLTLTAIATEGATGDQVSVPTASVSQDFTITTASFSVNRTEGNEDEFIPLEINQSADSAIQIKTLTISDLPNGAMLQVTGEYMGTGWVTSGAPGFEVSTFIAGGGNGNSTVLTDLMPSIIKAFIDSLQLKGPEDSDVNFDLDFDVVLFSTDTETLDDHPVIINVVADVPTASLGDSNNTTVITEDEWNALPILGAVKDRDGSEEITSFVIENVPVGSSFASNIGGSNLVGSQSGTTWTFTPTNAAALFETGNRDLNSSLFFKPPTNYPGPLNGGKALEDMELTVNVTDTESEAIDTTDSDTSFISVDLTNTDFLAVTDGGQDVTNGQTFEDTAYTVNALDFFKDNDGSEVFVTSSGDESGAEITISGFPIGETFLIDGIPTIITAGGSITILAADFNGLEITPPEHSDVDLDLTVTGFVQDKPGGSNVIDGAIVGFSQDLLINVDAVADVPTLTVTATPGNEHTGALVTITAALTDTDGTESMSIVVDLPEGAEFVDPAGVPFGARTGGASSNWSFGTLSGTSLTVNSGDLFVRWIDQDNSDNIEFTVTLTATEDPTDNEFTTSNNIAFFSVTETADITPVADNITFKTLDQAGFEDTFVPLNLGITLSDTDGSEVITEIVLEFYDLIGTNPISGTNNDPILDSFGNSIFGDIFAVELYDKDGVPIDPDSPASPGIYTLTPDQILGLQVRHVSLDPLDPDKVNHSNQDFRVVVNTTVTDTSTDDLETDTITQNALINIDMIGVADEAKFAGVSGGLNSGSATTVGLTSIEDTAIVLDSSNLAFTDTDGSEQMSVVVTLPASPAGATITSTDTIANPSTLLFIGNNTYTFNYTAAGPNPTISITPPENYSGPFDFDLKLVTTEDDGNSTSRFFKTSINITPVADPVSIASASQVIEDDSNDPSPDWQDIDVTFDLQDTDAGGETLTMVVLDSIAGDTGAMVRYEDPNNPTTFIEITNGATIPVAALGTLQVMPSDQSNVDIDLTFIATTDDGSSSVTHPPVTVTIDVVGDADVEKVDAPDVTSGNGQSFVNFSITTNFIDDLDGSETHYIIIDNVPATWALKTTDGPDPIYIGDDKWLLPSDPNHLNDGLEFSYLQTDFQLIRQGGEDEEELSIIATSRENDGDYDTAILEDVEINIQDEDSNISTQTDPTIHSISGGDEDTLISLTGLVTDATSVTIYNLPAGATLSAGDFFDEYTVTGILSGGFWVISVADLAGATIDPPADFSGELEFNVIATNALDGTLPGVNSATISIDIAPIADDADVTSDAVGDEDTDIDLKIVMTVGDIDTDGARGMETFEDVFITGVPAGAILTVTFADTSTTVYDADTDTQPFSIALNPDGSLPSLSVTPPEHSNVDFDLILHYTVIDENTDLGSIDSKDFTTTIPVDVTGVVDQPIIMVGAAFTQDESDIQQELDFATDLGINITLVDTDGSQTVHYKISGLTGDFNLSAGSNQGGGEWIVAAADIAGLKLIAPPNISGTFPLSIQAIVSENDGDFEIGAAVIQTITINPVADTPGVIIPATASADEDNNVAIPLQISTADIDGSETFDVTIMATASLPVGTILSLDGITPYVPLIGQTWTFPTLTVSALTDLQDLVLIPPANYSGEITLEHTIIVTDSGVSGTPIVENTVVTINPVADTPTALLDASYSGTEDMLTAINNLNFEAVDTDGSETFRVEITGYEAGTIFDQGSADGSMWVIDDLDATALSALTSLNMTAPEHYSGDDTLTFKVVSTETANNDEAFVEVMTDVSITPVADLPNLMLTSSNLTVESGADLNLSAIINAALVDTDGSETLSIQITGLEAGTLFDDMNNMVGVFDTGTYTLTSAELDNLNFNTSTSGPINGIEVTAIATEAANSDTASILANLDITVTDPIF